MVANHRKRSQIVANGRKRSQMVTNGRKRSQMVASRRKWSQTITNGRKHIALLLTAHLFVCEFSVYPAGAQTRDVDPMAGYFWPTLYDAEPTLAQYCVTMSCLAECGPASQTAGQH